MPVIDWTAVVRIGRQIGISQETLNTLGLYAQQYNRINAGVQEGIRLVRGRQLRGILNEVVGSEFPQFAQLQRSEERRVGKECRSRWGRDKWRIEVVE